MNNPKHLDNRTFTADYLKSLSWPEFKEFSENLDRLLEHRIQVLHADIGRTNSILRGFRG